MKQVSIYNINDGILAIMGLAKEGDIILDGNENKEYTILEVNPFEGICVTNLDNVIWLTPDDDNELDE